MILWTQGMLAHTRRKVGRYVSWMVALWILGAVAPATGYGQAWTAARGSFYTKLARGDIRAANQYTFDGRTADFIDGVADNAFVDRSFHFSEWGLLDNLTLVLTAPLSSSLSTTSRFAMRRRPLARPRSAFVSVFSPCCVYALPPSRWR